MDLVFYLIIAFFAGILVKIVDHIEDEEKKKHLIRFPLAVIYGILIGYLISQAPFSMIFLGAVIAQVLMRKVDTQTHKIGILFVLLSLLYLGLPNFYFLQLAAFLIFASLDELDKIIFWQKPKWVQDFRPFLELAAIPFALMGQWHYLAGMLSFDIGYLSIGVMSEASKNKRNNL